MDFSNFCNICLTPKNVLNISREENTRLFNTFTRLIGQPEVGLENIVYLCLYCWRKLNDINKFKEMCIKNFVQFRKSCYDFKRQLEIIEDSNINNKIKVFIEAKIKEQCSDDENEGLRRDYDCTETEDEKIELNQVFIKDEPHDMVLEDEQTLNYNKHTPSETKNIKSESFEKEYKLESEIDLGITTFFEGESNSLVTPKENLNNYMSVAVKNISTREITTEKSTEIPVKNRNATSERYVCNICEKSFSKAYNLERHRFIHTGERPYRCNICSKTFCDSSNLKIHHRQHTGEKPFECDICHKSFTDLSHLNRHRLIHTGEKPHECNICHKSFLALSCLNRHRQIHTAEKPHICNLCKKTFSKSSYLKVHRLLHTGEKPHECDICKKAFAVPSNLKRHRVTHTR